MISSVQSGAAFAPEIRGIKVKDFCVLAAQELDAKAPATDQVLVALGAISNMYCLYALEHPATRIARLSGFSSTEIADRNAVLVEIQRALPGTEVGRATAILKSLNRALNTVFESNSSRYMRLTGFGVFEVIDLAKSEYLLTLESPLASR